MCNKGVLIWTVLVKRANSCGRHCHPWPDLYQRYLLYSSNYKFLWSIFFFFLFTFFFFFFCLFNPSLSYRRTYLCTFSQPPWQYVDSNIGTLSACKGYIKKGTLFLLRKFKFGFDMTILRLR